MLSVVLEMDASDMLRATARGGFAIDRVALDPEAPAAAAPRSATVDSVLSAWRARDLVIVIAPGERPLGAGGERAYRLRAHDGDLTGEDIGPARQARQWARALHAEPGDRDTARALGRLLVPPGPGDRTLHVLAIGELGGVPLAALRDDTGLIVGRRPLARVLALRASHPGSSGDGPSLIMADPKADLPSARQEGEAVWAALGRTVELVGAGRPAAATSDRLWTARDARLLHIASHVGIRGRWRALRLADHDVIPSEIVSRQLAPRLAVLASCGSAAALDEEGWGSIAAALLEAGTAVVIATDRSVRDQAALALMQRFYAQPDWADDPARALGRVQQEADHQGAASPAGGPGRVLGAGPAPAGHRAVAGMRRRQLIGLAARARTRRSPRQRHGSPGTRAA